MNPDDKSEQAQKGAERCYRPGRRASRRGTILINGLSGLSVAQGYA
jgi:hypothetical protein